MSNLNESGSGDPPMYKVTAEREDKRWLVHIEDETGRTTTTETKNLDDIETAVWDHLADAAGERPGQLQVEVRLPAEIRTRLDVAERLRSEAAGALHAAVRAMSEADFATRDIDNLIGEPGRIALGRRRAVITNAAIATYGLEDHPEAIAVAWDDHGHFATLTCRSCVESNREEYAELTPEGENVLVYDANDRYCDRCQKDLDTDKRPWIVR
ncbi:MAG TPA: hypothetical protein VGJ86_21940 [Acidimicrobiales bacterium]|jgi:hypothetical protein